MSKMGDFIAFNAAVELMKERGKENCLKELLKNAKTCNAIISCIQKM